MISLANLLKISIIKTIRLNLHYFGFSGIKMPIVVCKNFKLKVLRGRVHFSCKIEPGIVVLGSRNIDIGNTGRGIWRLENDSEVNFKGRASFAAGSVISCSPNSVLSIGANTTINVNSRVICAKKIEIGNDCSISWDCLVMDSDWHHIVLDGEVKEKDKEIKICDKVWICSGTMILKGAYIKNDSVIAARSIITKFIPSNSLAGNCNQIIREGVSWEK